MSQKPQLQYPARFIYKIIVKDPSRIEEVVSQAIGERQHRLSKSSTSQGGKYTSFNLELTARSKADHEEIHTKIKSHKDVVYLL